MHTHWLVSIWECWRQTEVETTFGIELNRNRFFPIEWRSAETQNSLDDISSWMTYPEELGSIPRYATARSQTDMRLPLRRFWISGVKGSTPWATGCNKGVNWVGKQSKQADCKSIGLRLRGFESLPTHKNGIAGFLFEKTRLAHVGYITSSILCGVSSTVECQPSKLNMRVRFPYSAPDTVVAQG